MNTSTDFIGFSTVVVEKLSRSRIPPPNSGSFDSVRLRLTTLGMTILICSHSLEAPAVYGMAGHLQNNLAAHRFRKAVSRACFGSRCFLPHRFHRNAYQADRDRRDTANTGRRYRSNYPARDLSGCGDCGPGLSHHVDALGIAQEASSGRWARFISIMLSASIFIDSILYPYSIALKCCHA